MVVTKAVTKVVVPKVIKTATKEAVKRSAGDSSGSSVFVRGFDFGTTDEQLEAHMSSVGTIQSVKWITKGSAEVTYSSVDEAAAAVEQLAKTTIEGNSRHMTVSLADGEAAARKGKGKGKWQGGGNQWQGGGGDGGGGGGLIGTLLGALLGQQLGGGGGGGGDSWGGGGKSWGKGQQNTFKIDRSGGELGEFTGVIKSFADKTNYGFIECAEAGQGDIFLHGDQKKGYQQGMTVKFDCILNKEGKAVAINLKSGLK